MTITELIAHLEDALDQHGDIDVLIDYQPNWPLQVNVETVTTVGGRVTYLAAGDAPEMPYAPDDAWAGGDVDWEDEEEGLLV